MSKINFRTKNLPRKLCNLLHTIPEDQILNAKNKVFEFNEYKP